VVTAASYSFCWRATGAASARPSLRPHFKEGVIFQTSSGAAMRRENASAWLVEWQGVFSVARTAYIVVIGDA